MLGVSILAHEPKAQIDEALWLYEVPLPSIDLGALVSVPRQFSDSSLRTSWILHLTEEVVATHQIRSGRKAFRPLFGCNEEAWLQVPNPFPEHVLVDTFSCGEAVNQIGMELGCN
jgi:hypothetical protein